MSAESNLAQLRYGIESTYGSVPSGTPTLQSLRLTGERLKETVETVLSQELEGTGNINDLIRTALRGEGPINYELSKGTYDDFFTMALRASGSATSFSVWSTAVNITTNITFGTPSGAGLQTMTSTSSAMAGLSAGSWIRITAANDAANIGIFKILTKTDSDNITIVNPNGASDTSASCTMEQGEEITNNVVTRSITLEKQFSDLSSVYMRYPGSVMGGYSMQVNAQGVVNGAFSVLATKETGETATFGDGSPTAAPTGDIYNTVDDVSYVLVGNAVYPVTQFTLNVDSSPRPRVNVGSAQAASYGFGRFNCTGSHSQYFDGQTELDKYRAGTRSSVAIILDKDDDVYVFDQPSVKYSDGEASASGVDTDVLKPLSWQAIKDASEGITQRIVRFAAA